MQTLEPMPLTKDTFGAHFPVYKNIFTSLISTTLWLALEDNLFNWELELKGSNKNLRTCLSHLFTMLLQM
jgi:hypothetical protein